MSLIEDFVPLGLWFQRFNTTRDEYQLEAGLQVRRRQRKRLARRERVPLPAPAGPRDRWSMDFMADTLSDGRTFRTLNIVDDFTRECVAIEVDRSLPGARVVRVLERCALVARPDERCCLARPQ